MSTSEFCHYDSDGKIWSGRKSTPMYNPDANLGSLILQRLIQSPKNVFQISDDSGSSLTNLDIYSRSIKFIQFLSTKCNVKQHDVVGVISSNTENLLPIFFACFTLGSAVNPLAIIMNESDVCFMWSKTRPKVIFTDTEIVKTVSGAVQKMELDATIVTMTGKVDGFLSTEEVLEVEAMIEDFEYPELLDISSTNALILCSSGTTNSPKGICHSHKDIITQYYPHFIKTFATQETIFIASSSYWTTFTILALSAALYGHKIVITKQHVNHDLWINIVNRHEVTTVLLTPPFANDLIKLLKMKPVSSLRNVMFGGCAFSEKIVNDLKSVFPNAFILPSYGNTESGFVSITSKDGPYGRSSGYPVTGTQIKITDENGTPLGPNEIGEVCIKSQVPFTAYYNDLEQYKAAFDSSGFFKSGDSGYFDSEGRLYIIDRIKHMIKAKDIALTPLELEEVINSIDGVIQSCVVGVFDENQFRDVIYAFIIKDSTRLELDQDFVMNFVNDKVIEAKRITGGVVFIDKFPTTPSGKILNRELKKMAQEIHFRGRD